MSKYSRFDVMPVVQSVIGTTDEIDEALLLAEYGLDSITMVNLFIALENHFQVTFLNEDLTSENFQSIETMLRILERAKNI